MKDEYIRKQDATNWLKQYGQDVLHGKYKFSLMYIWKNIKDLPSADVAPVVHAYWRDTGSGQECSACKEIQYGYDTGRHYCANCGAKTDGKEQNV